MTIAEWLEKHKPKYEDRRQWVKDCADALGVSVGAVKNKAPSVWPLGQHFPGPKAKARPKHDDMIPADEFLAKVDIVGKVLKYLNETVGDNYIEDDKLRRMFEIPQSRWRDMVKLPAFADRQLSYEQSAGGRRVTVWSSKKGVQAARETISMARYEQ